MEDGGDKGTAQCIQKINTLAPDFVIAGGDQLMDAYAVGYEEADQQYKLWEKHQSMLQMPVHHVLGNHEVFGFDTESGVALDHPDFGKGLFKDRMGSGKTYYSFDHKGWHFVVLDSVRLLDDRSGYDGYIDAEQMNWLERDLQNAGDTPKIFATHIPLYTLREQMFNDPWGTPGHNLLIGNANDLRTLLEANNVKLVLQGHVHIRENIIFNGIQYISSGAVCGAWWRGPMGKTPEGFAIITCTEDKATYEYLTYGWQAEN
jgi:3',5'-cyclic AMP phosphodiesterase CpdA